MLNEEDITWLIALARQRLRDVSDQRTAGIISAKLFELEKKLEQPVEPLELLIHCPRCLEQHVDEGEFATKPHKNHSCQFCGLTFQASGPVESIGVQFFRGYKNQPKLELPPEFVMRASGGRPQISLPTGLPDYMRIVHTGQNVRFDATKVNDGFDLEKTFVIAEIKFTTEGTQVRLEGDGPKEWYPADYFLVQQPGKPPW